MRLRTAIAILLCTLAPVSAQQSNPTGFTATVYYSKVLPGKAQAYAAFMRTGIGATAMRAILKVNPSLAAITVRSVAFTGYPRQEASHVLIFSHTGEMNWPKGWQDAFRAETGMTTEEYFAKAREFVEGAGSQMLHVHHSVNNAPSQEGEVVVIDRIKLKKGQSAYSALMRETALPLAQERVKGGELLGWTFSHTAFPTGSSLPWQATVLRRYKDMASASRVVSNPGGAAARFAKVFPNRSYMEYMDRLREAGEVVRTDMETIIAVFRR